MSFSTNRMQFHLLKRNTPNRTKKRIGRGGIRGKTSGRGHKGQKQHGGTPRPEMRDLIKRLPKRRGYGKNRARTINSGRVETAVVNVGSLSEKFSQGELINPATLIKSGLVKARGGKTPPMKVLADGPITDKFSFEGVKVSSTARAKIEKAGGTIK